MLFGLPIRSLWIACLALFILALGYGLERLNNRLTDGFSPDAITAPLSDDREYAIAPLEAGQQQDIHRILQQQFSYLAKGTQSFVFASQDGRYIIKFFKQKHLRLPWYRSILSYVPIFNQYVDRKVQRRLLKRAKIYSGCKLAYDEMQEDTGVLYLHLTPSSDLPNPMTLVDKRGVEYQVDPNTLDFFLQKRGVPLYAALKDYRLRNDIQGAKQALAKLFDYLVDRSQRGILDRDPAYPQNLGFIDRRAGNLDVGNLTKDPLIRNRIEYKRRIQEHLIDLRQWLVTHFPELVPTYDDHLEAL